jgi:deazaflavin-dependent oxidoreductase (nitroreductase family)
MPDPKINPSEHDFPKGLAQPALRALFGAGYTRLGQLTNVSETDLLKLHGMGPKAIGLLRASLNARGQSFANQNVNEEKMEKEEPIYNNPQGWVRSHIQEYVDSDGQQGHLWRGITTLLLTYRGRKSGKLRRTGLIYGRDGVNYVVVASNGGAPNHPQWYLNLLENPEVDVQVVADKFTAHARTATPEERQRLWPVMSKIFPQYDHYQAIASREIPLVILERV